jgi:4-alpha-glucanotransferase
MIPMQDLLGLGQEGRMNYPSVAHGNWEWRLLTGQLTDGVAQFLRDLTETYGRTT